MTQRVLVIEDDAVLREGVSRALERAGLTVTVAEDGYAGVREAEGQTFDVIICDYEMPGINGGGVWERLSPEHQKRFILWTGNGTVASPSGIKAMKDCSSEELLAYVRMF